MFTQKIHHVTVLHFQESSSSTHLGCGVRTLDDEDDGVEDEC